MTNAALNGKKAFLITVGFGTLGIFIFSFQFGNSMKELWAYLSLSLLISGAAFFFGGLLGFLFGIPYTRQSEENGNEAVAYKVNTNLEKISDWLTGIIIGLTLVNLQQIPAKFMDLFDYLKMGFSNPETAKILIGTLVIYFLITGFISGYLMTRTQISTLFRIADKGMVFNNQQSNLLNKIAEMLATSKPLTAEEINQLAAEIDSAPSLVKETIFAYAKNYRKLAYRKKNTAVITKIAHILGSIVESDVDNLVHAYRGQWGYALKDQETPDYKRANEAFTDAINIRGSWESKGYTLYEFNRAICRIKLQETPGEALGFNIEDIKNDLGVAAQSVDLQKSMAQEKVFVDWLKKHNIKLADLIAMNHTSVVPAEKSPKTK